MLPETMFLVLINLILTVIVFFVTSKTFKNYLKSSFSDFENKVSKKTKKWLSNWWVNVANSESPIFFFNEARFLLKILVPLNESKVNLLQWSCLLTSFSMLSGQLIFIFSTKNSLFTPEVVNEMMLLILYAVFINQLLKSLKAGTNSNKILFNWFLRFVYLRFLANEVCRPALIIFQKQEESISRPFFFGVLASVVLILLFEDFLKRNQIHSLRRFSIFYILLIFWITLTLWFTRHNERQLISQLYFSLDKWILNFTFDYLTFFISVYLLKKVTNHKFWKNLSLLFLDLFLATALAVLLYFLYYILDVIMVNHVNGNSLVSFEVMIIEIKKQIVYSFENHKYQHLIYSSTTLIPTFLFLFFIILSFIVKTGKRKVGLLSQHFFLKEVSNQTPFQSSLNFLGQLIAFVISLVLALGFFRTFNWIHDSLF